MSRFLSLSLIFSIQLLLLTLLSSPCKMYAQTHNNTINGHIFDAQRKPLSDIYVELLNEANGVLARVKTNSGGRYFFGGLSGGSFTIKVLPYGTNLEEQSTEVNIGTNGIPGRSPSENVQQDFYLRPRKNSAEEKSITGTIFVQEIPEEAQKLYEKALDSFNQKHTDEGIAKLQESINIFPTYYLALLRLGQEYAGLQKWGEANETFKRAVSINPRSFLGWYGLGFSSKESQLVEEAIKATQEAVSINSASVDANLLLGICQRKAKQFSEAEKSFKQADKLAKGKSADVHWNLALLYAHNMNNFAGAADQLELYLKVNPKVENSEDVKKLIKQFRNKALENK